jgi:hypothetical protein
MSSGDNASLPVGAGVPDTGASQGTASPLATPPTGDTAATAALPLNVLCGLADPREAARLHALPPFDPRVLDFLSDVSAALLSDPAAKAYPDVAAFAFFCRRASLAQLKAPYAGLAGRLGRGLVFHIAPGNVPMNFAYSLAAGLLSGNANVVKAPSRRFEQVSLTCAHLRAQLAGAHAALAGYVNVLEYPRERQDITETFSALCDARVIWGGDETIRRVREAPLAPRAFDVTFADRWSLLVVDAAYVAAMDENTLAAAALGFYNDTYLYDQNACTTPRLVYWLGSGDTLAAAQARFWQAVHAVAAPRYPVDPVAAVDKRIALYQAAVELGGATLAPMPDNLVVRITLDALTPEAADLRCGGGCFLEYAAPTLDPLAPLLSQKAQTVSCLGVAPEAIAGFVLNRGLRGVDRVTRIGHTMDFSLVWDGYDLIETLTRRVDLQ